MLYFNELPRPVRRQFYFKRHHLQQSTGTNTAPLHMPYTRCKCRQNARGQRQLLPYVKEYCENSSLHGIRYLTDTKLLPFEKLIWLLLLCATSICLIYVYIELANIYKSDRLLQTVDNSVYPVFNIPFPSVGLCPRNRLNWLKLQHEAPQLFLGSNASLLQQAVFIEFFDGLGAAHFNQLNTLQKIFTNNSLVQQLPVLDHLDITEVLRYLMLSCEDIFTDFCYWRGQKRNCCTLFVLERTEAGFCYVFNSAVSPELQERAKRDKYYPYHNPNFGESTGLNFQLLFNATKVRTNNLSSRGVYVMVKQPDQWCDDVTMAIPDAYTKIIITPKYSATDRRTRVITPEMRGCLFDDEDDNPMYKKIPGLRYWRGNCRTRCHQEYVFALCNCTPSVFFPIAPTDPFRDCKASDYECLYKFMHIFREEHHKDEEQYLDDFDKNSMTCDCLNSCTQLVFDRVQSSIPLQNETVKPLANIYLDIFFQSRFMIKYEKRMRFTFVEYIAGFGGIMGLFLGASLLSAIELVYYFTIGLYFYLRDDCKGKPQKSTGVRQTHKIKPQKHLF